MSMATRKELIEAVGLRYREASTSERTRILDELVALAGYHRKHAIRLLAEGPPGEQAVQARHRLYDEAVRQALIVLWEAADRICGKRLQAVLPDLITALEQHGHLTLDPTVRQRLLTASAATIDRLLASVRRTASGRKKRKTVTK